MKSVAQLAMAVALTMGVSAMVGCESSVTQSEGSGGGGGAGGSTTATGTTTATGPCVDPSCGECPASIGEGDVCSTPNKICTDGQDCGIAYLCSEGIWEIWEECWFEPVECTLDGGPYVGYQCETVGEICDQPGGCSVKCSEDHFWYEACPTCPEEVPVAGDLCDPALIESCDYTVETTCGPKPATATCDAPSGLWVVEVEPC